MGSEDGTPRSVRPPGGLARHIPLWLAIAVSSATVTYLLLAVSEAENAAPSCIQLSREPSSLSRLHEDTMRQKYLEVLRDSLTAAAFRKTEMDASACWVEKKKIKPFCPPMNPVKRHEGGDARSPDWPITGVSMIGTLRMNNIRELLERAEQENIPGDFMECGVWRGGASIFAQAVLSSANIDRHVWLADSFRGLPPPRTSKDTTYWNEISYLEVPNLPLLFRFVSNTGPTLLPPTQQVSMEEVIENFKAFGLYHPERLHFCKGYFVDSLPHCHPSKIAVLRMDGDMYESTMDQLFNLYPLVSLGGFVIVDDWTIEYAREAVKDFWEWHGLLEEVTPVSIDRYSIYWQKPREVSLQWHRKGSMPRQRPFKSTKRTWRQSHLQAEMDAAAAAAYPMPLPRAPGRQRHQQSTLLGDPTDGRSSSRPSELDAG
ncbi:Macrocin O-methyltransferase [Balamuthia mandrillaris]